MEKYNYNESAYVSLSIHRIATHLDPRNTSNLMVIDVLHEADTLNKNSDQSSLYDLMGIEMDRLIDAMPMNVSIAHKMVYHQITVAWIKIIQSMIFRESLHGMLYGEYKTIIDNVIKPIVVGDKNALLYRMHVTGETFFHLAAKSWIIRKFNMLHDSPITQKIESLENELTYIFNCYEEFGKVVESGNKYTINYLEDFSKTCLKDYLNRFVEDLISMSI